MTAINIITLIVVSFLTLIVFCLAWLAYSSCLKAYKSEVKQGLYDNEIWQEGQNKKNRIRGLVGTIFTYTAFSLLIGLFATGLVFKINNQPIVVNNKTILVIRSGSMSDFYNDEVADKNNHDRSLQFDVGDICVFETQFQEPRVGEVYGYRYKNIIITHRLVGRKGTAYEFRGDNNPYLDGYVSRNQIVFHYTGVKVIGIGAFILYAQSYFGIWSLFGITTILISSEIVYSKLKNINRNRTLILLLTFNLI